VTLSNTFKYSGVLQLCIVDVHLLQLVWSCLPHSN